MQTISSNSNGAANPWGGAVGTLAVRGTFGNGTITMEYCPGTADPTVAGNWAAVSGISFTSAGQTNFSLGPGNIRVVLAGATNPSITYDFLPILQRPH